MGASDTINVRKVDLGAKVMELTGGNGIERICEASGHAPTLNSSFKWGIVIVVLKKNKYI